MMAGRLRVVYFCWDSVQPARETAGARRRDRQQTEPLHVRGISNVVLLAGVAAAVALLRAPGREVVIVALGAISLWRTPHAIRRANGFTASPMDRVWRDRKSTRLNSSHLVISYAVFCL